MIDWVWKKYTESKQEEFVWTMITAQSIGYLVYILPDLHIAVVTYTTVAYICIFIC